MSEHESAVETSDRALQAGAEPAATRPAGLAVLAGASSNGPPAATEPAAPRAHLLDFDLASLSEWLVARGEPKYRAAQILDWVYHKHAVRFDEMTNLSKALRAGLSESAVIFSSEVAADSLSTDGTRKLLLRWPDGRTTETVWIPEPDRNTVCVSSQVGCPVGCTFCASGIDGVQRNLSSGEIVEQVLRVERLIGAQRGVTNVVFMGMGEPLANYDAVLRAVRTLNADWGLHLGARRITISTVGLPQQIRRLAGEGLQVNLALSLHAPDQELRQRLIPWGKVRIDDLMRACGEFFQQTGREVTFEYVLLAGVNDLPQHATGLATLARRARANVNLLRYNPVAGLPFQRPTSEQAHRFQASLRARGVNAHIRTSRGQDIDAACGQLRRRVESSAPR